MFCFICYFVSFCFFCFNFTVTDTHVQGYSMYVCNCGVVVLGGQGELPGGLNKPACFHPVAARSQPDPHVRAALRRDGPGRVRSPEPPKPALFLPYGGYRIASSKQDTASRLPDTILIPCVAAVTAAGVAAAGSPLAAPLRPRDPPHLCAACRSPAHTATLSYYDRRTEVPVGHAFLLHSGGGGVVVLELR
ncbi:hypothetical protein BDR26DRAFT_878651 [Obelidium mucronatum]|nr:hypothetical protein BDR26DRAFT_878651 [Obelidium mucronatum]